MDQPLIPLGLTRVLQVEEWAFGAKRGKKYAGLSEWVIWKGVSSLSLSVVQMEIPGGAAEAPLSTERLDWRLFGISFNMWLSNWTLVLECKKNKISLRLPDFWTWRLWKITYSSLSPPSLSTVERHHIWHRHFTQSLVREHARHPFMQTLIRIPTRPSGFSISDTLLNSGHLNFLISEMGIIELNLTDLKINESWLEIGSI